MSCATRARDVRLRQAHECPVTAPYRLDLTVTALRRLSTNLVDVFTPAGEYVRALPGSHGPVAVRVIQPRPDSLTVTLDGDPRDHAPALAVVRRMLGVDRDVEHFRRAAAGIPWLSPLAGRMRGVRPPRYATLWEACVNAIAFQQISLQAASAIVTRLIIALGRPLERGGVRSYVFPSARTVLSADDAVLRAAGLSGGKVAALRHAGEALAAGTLGEPMLEDRASDDAAGMLRGIRGIGPWTATVILLRGLGRLDVFPAGDSSVTRNLAMVAGPIAPREVGRALAALRPEQGMLYYHLLLARLESRGELPRS